MTIPPIKPNDIALIIFIPKNDKIKIPIGNNNNSGEITKLFLIDTPKLSKFEL